MTAAAAFDFDGTLSQRDTMIPFLVRIAGWPRLLAATASALRHTRRRDEVKVAVVGDLVRGMSADELAVHGRDYAATLAGVLRPEIVERLRWHQAEGHAVALVSAGLEVYLRPLATELGVDDVLGVALVADADGRITGAVDGGLNNRGPQKVARLRTWLDERFGANAAVELWAYGDSSGDEELLAYADHPTWVGRRARRNGQPLSKS
jgi:phosphatidylglycerophosphatase C